MNFMTSFTSFVNLLKKTFGRICIFSEESCNFAPIFILPQICTHVTQFKKYILTLTVMLFACLSACAGQFTLVIDAGHGGNDPGAVGAVTKEKTINLNVALALGKLIEKNCPDVRVIYTRKTDVFVTLQERANIANRAKANLFISIHTNSAGKDGASAIGAETYTLGMHRAADNLAVAKRENSVITMESGYKQKYQGFDPNKAESYIIFELMQDKYMAQSVKLAQAIQKQYASAGRKNKGVHQAGFLVLRETSMPSILTELGFISNPTEEKFLASTEGVNKMAQSIYEGFRSYRKQLAELDGAPSADAPYLASANGGVSMEHAAEGAAQGIAEDVVPSIRPVKTVPYPTGVQADSVKTTPKAEPAKPTEPKAEPKTQPKAEPKTEPKTEPAKPTTPKAEPKTEPKPQPKTEPAKPATPKTEPKPQPKAEPKTEPKPQPKAEPAKPSAPAAGKPEFRLQLFTSTAERKPGDAAFKGLEAEYYKDGDTYKYTYGRTASYDDILDLKKTISEKFPGVFIVALLDGKRIDLQQAIELSKQK